MPLHLNPEDEDKDNLLGTSTGIPVDPEPLPIIKQLKSVDQGIKEGRIDGEALLNSETPEALAFETFKKKETGRAIKKGIEAGRIDREKLSKAEPDLSTDLMLAEVEEKSPGSFARIIEMRNTLRKVALNTEAEDESGAQMLTEKDSENLENMQMSLDSFTKMLEKEGAKGVRASNFHDLMNVVGNFLSSEQIKKTEALKLAKFRQKTNQDLTEKDIEALTLESSGAAEPVSLFDPSDPIGLITGILTFVWFGFPKSALGMLTQETGLGLSFPLLERAAQILNGENQAPLTVSEFLFPAGIGLGLGTGVVGGRLLKPIIGKVASRFSGKLDIQAAFRSPVARKKFALPAPEESVTSPITNTSREPLDIKIADDVPTTVGNVSAIKSRNPSASVDDIVLSESTAVDFAPANPIEFFSAATEANNAFAKKAILKGFLPVQKGSVFKRLLKIETGAAGDIPPDEPIRKFTKKQIRAFMGTGKAKKPPLGDQFQAPTGERPEFQAGRDIPLETPIQPLSEAELQTGVIAPVRAISGQSTRRAAELSPGAGKYLNTLDSSRHIKATARKFSLKRLRQSFKRNFVDVSGNVKKALRLRGEFGVEAARRHELALGANGRAITRIDDMHAAVYEGLSKEQKFTLDEYIITRTRLDSTIRRQGLRDAALTDAQFLPEELRAIRIKEIESDPLLRTLKNPGGAVEEDLRQVLQNAYPEEMLPMLEQRSDAFFATMRKELDGLLDEGIISVESHKKLYNNNYSRIEFFEHIDPDIPSTGPGGGTKVTVTSSGIKKLKAGAEGELDLDTDELAMQIISRNQKIIMKNRANRPLYDLAFDDMQQGVGNRIVELPTMKKRIENLTDADAVIGQIDDQFVEIVGQAAEPRPGWKIISMFRDGQKQDIYMIDELAKEWIQRDPMMSVLGAEYAQWFSGSKILKFFATGGNPEFALTNFPRDQTLVFLTNQEYSSFLPLHMAQMGRDLFETFSDSVTGKGMWAKYIEEGGDMSFLSQQAFNKAPKPRNSTLRKLQEVASYVGSVSERWTRMALMNRALKNGRSMSEAVHTARTYLDFSQGGHVAKGMDNFIPYLNATIQATRSAAGAAKRNPRVFAWKMGQLSALAFAGAATLYTEYRDLIEMVPESTRARSWILPLPWKFTDDEGNTRHRYMAIPKDQTAIFFTGLADTMARRIYLDEIPSDTKLKALKRSWDDLAEPIKQSFSLLGASSLAPPTFQAGLALLFNKDIWRNEDVWYDANGFNNVFPWAEYYKTTNPFYKQIGKSSKDIFGVENSISPARLERAVQKIAPTTVWSTGLDFGYKTMRDALSDDEAKFTDRIIDDQVRKIPFARKLIKTTPRLSQQEIRKVEASKKESNTERILQNRSMDDILYGMDRKEAELDDLKKYISAFDENTQKRLIKRAITFKKLSDIPERSWWMNRASIQSPEERASIMWDEYKNSEPENRRRMLIIMNRIPGFASKRFRAEIGKLKRIDAGK